MLIDGLESYSELTPARKLRILAAHLGSTEPVLGSCCAWRPLPAFYKQGQTSLREPFVGRGHSPCGGESI